MTTARATTPRKCAICDGKVEGSILGLTVHLCCTHCCATKLKTHELPIVPKSSAIHFYGCREKYLRLLSSLPTRDRTVGGVSPTYLTVEVRCLGVFGEYLAKTHMIESNEKRPRPKLSRPERIARSIHVADAELICDKKRVLLVCLFGGFCGQRRQPNKKPAELRRRLIVLPRVLEILHECPGAHPSAAFDFCVQYPAAGPVEFQELKDKMRRVFRIEGRRIFGHLSDDESLVLWNTPLQGDVFQTEEGRIEIRTHLTEHIDVTLADKIMTHPDSQRYIDCGGEASVLATKLLEFWTERCDVAEREMR